MVLPDMSIRFAPDGIRSRAPTALMRLSSTRMVPFSITSSPRMVTRRAFTRATSPRGRAVSKSKPMTVARGAAGFSSLASALLMFSRLCS